MKLRGTDSRGSSGTATALAGPCPATPPSTERPASVTSLLMAMRAGSRWLRKTGVRPLFPARSRRLRVTETVQLGEKRFLSIVEVDGMDYLVGGGTAAVALLTRLGAAAPVHAAFDQAIDEAWRQGGASL